MGEKESLATDLEALLSGEIDARALRRKYGQLGPASVLEAVWPNLQHYLDDADIRAGDEAYREFQDRELGQLIHLLRQNAPAEQLRRVTFLKVS
jgi:hypothetical protein